MAVDNRARGVHRVAVDLGHVIRDARGKMTQEALASAASATGATTDQTTISRIERGERLPGLDEILAIEAALGLSPGHLLVRAGIIAGDSVEVAIAADPELDDDQRGYLMNAYRGALALSNSRRRSRER